MNNNSTQVIKKRNYIKKSHTIVCSESFSKYNKNIADNGCM